MVAKISLFQGAIVPANMYDYTLPYNFAAWLNCWTAYLYLDSLPFSLGWSTDPHDLGEISSEQAITKN